MQIYVAQIPPEGVFLSEDIPSEKLDLATEIIKFRGLVQVKAEIFKITNALTVILDIKASIFCLCGRCVEEFDLLIEKHFKISYFVDRIIPDFAIETQNRDVKEGCRFGRKKCAHTFSM